MIASSLLLAALLTPTGLVPITDFGAKPEKADELYEKLIAAWREKGIRVETGVFRTEMKVSLVNDGPVTILLDSEKLF